MFGIFLKKKDSVVNNSNTNRFSESNITYEDLSDGDPLYNEVLEFAIGTGKISASLIQRRFRFGYNRAARMIDLLESNGIVGPQNGSKPREVLIKTYDNIEELKIYSKTNDINESIDTEEIIPVVDIKYDDKDYCKKLTNTLILDRTFDIEDMTRSLLELNSPRQLKMVLIDFSKLYLTRFNGSENLLCPVVTDHRKAVIVLNKICNELEKRVELFSEMKVKKFDSENMDIPYILVVIDEIYDLLLDKEAHTTLVKLLKNSEVVGIKLVALSKFNTKNLSLGPLENLLKIYNKFDFSSMVLNVSKENKNILDTIDNDYDGFDFEKYSADLLYSNGFEEISVTKSSGDFGVDIIAYKNEIKYAIQCKKYSSPVGIKAVQEVIGSKSMNRCQVAAVFTNNYFTKSAKELASENGVLLWDRDKLIELIDKKDSK